MLNKIKQWLDKGGGGDEEITEFVEKLKQK